MTKKLLIIVSVLFALLFISTASFAVTHNPVNAIHNTTSGAIQGVNNAVHNTANNVRNSAHNVTHPNTGTTTHQGTTGTTTHQGTTGARTHLNTPNRVGTRYGTTRTAADTTPTTHTARTTANVVTWVVLGVAAVVIIGLIWFYASSDVRRDR